MNGWADPEPAWWLNLQAHPEATVELPDGTREVTARAATGEERARLWAALIAHGSVAYADASSHATFAWSTAVVVLEPRGRGGLPCLKRRRRRRSPCPAGWSARSGSRIARAYAITRGRFGLRRPTETKWGTLRLKTVGRKTGKERDRDRRLHRGRAEPRRPGDERLGPAEPAWWLNLQAHPRRRSSCPRLARGDRACGDRGRSGLGCGRRWSPSGARPTRTRAPPCDPGRPRSSSWSRGSGSTGRPSSTFRARASGTLGNGHRAWRRSVGARRRDQDAEGGHHGIR